MADGKVQSPDEIFVRHMQELRAQSMQNIPNPGSHRPVWAVQIKKIGSVDISDERTRIYFAPDELLGTIDVITLRGMSYAAMPGTRVKVTLDIVEEGSEA